MSGGLGNGRKMRRTNIGASDTRHGGMLIGVLSRDRVLRWGEGARRTLSPQFWNSKGKIGAESLVG